MCSAEADEKLLQTSTPQVCQYSVSAVLWGVSFQFSSESREKSEEEVSAVSGQLCCGDIMSGQRTHMNSVSSYELRNNNFSRY
jgi:hypothetical protein